MAVLTQRSGYRICEQFRVQTNGTTPVDILQVLPGTVIDHVVARCETPGTGAANLTIGDDDDADGFVLAGDHTAAAGTLYGDITTERGAYLFDVTNKGGHHKAYNLNKTLRLLLSAAGATQGTLQDITPGPP